MNSVVHANSEWRRWQGIPMITIAMTAHQRESTLMD
jgi:hypothetical protein